MMGCIIRDTAHAVSSCKPMGCQSWFPTYTHLQSLPEWTVKVADHFTSDKVHRQVCDHCLRSCPFLHAAVSNDLSKRYNPWINTTVQILLAVAGLVCIPICRRCLMSNKYQAVKQNSPSATQERPSHWLPAGNLIPRNVEDLSLSLAWKTCWGSIQHLCNLPRFVVSTSFNPSEILWKSLASLTIDPNHCKCSIYSHHETTNLTSPNRSQFGRQCAKTIQAHNRSISDFLPKGNLPALTPCHTIEMQSSVEVSSDDHWRIARHVTDGLDHVPCHITYHQWSFQANVNEREISAQQTPNHLYHVNFQNWVRTRPNHLRKSASKDCPGFSWQFVGRKCEYQLLGPSSQSRAKELHFTVSEAHVIIICEMLLYTWTMMIFLPWGSLIPL